MNDLSPTQPRLVLYGAGKLIVAQADPKAITWHQGDNLDVSYAVHLDADKIRAGTMTPAERRVYELSQEAKKDIDLESQNHPEDTYEPTHKPCERYSIDTIEIKPVANTGIGGWVNRAEESVGQGVNSVLNGLPPVLGLMAGMVLEPFALANDFVNKHIGVRDTVPGQFEPVYTRQFHEVDASGVDDSHYGLPRGGESFRFHKDGSFDYSANTVRINEVR